MITDYRPVPEPVYEMIWNGTIEADGIRSRQRPAPPLWASYFVRGGCVRRVLETLRTKPAGKVWSVPQLIEASGLSDGSVYIALRQLQRAHVVCVEKVDIGMGAVQQLRVWLAS